MNVLLVYNDGLIDSFDTKDDMSQEYTHARLSTFVEEADTGEDRYEIGIDLVPIIHSNSRDLPTIRRLCSTTFISDYHHSSRPSIDVVCSMISGLSTGGLRSPHSKENQSTARSSCGSRPPDTVPRR